MITIFQVITMEGWADIMYMVEDTSDNIFTLGYFSSLIIIGSFLLINLILAVIMRVFTQNEEIERMKQKQKKLLDERHKLRKNPKAYLRPLKVGKVERSKSTNLKRKFSLLDLDEDSSSNSKLIDDFRSKKF